jgi:hypothetical protein
MASNFLSPHSDESLRRSTEDLTELLAATETLEKAVSDNTETEAPDEDPLRFSPELVSYLALTKRQALMEVY